MSATRLGSKLSTLLCCLAVACSGAGAGRSPAGGGAPPSTGGGPSGANGEARRNVAACPADELPGLGNVESGQLVSIVAAPGCSVELRARALVGLVQIGERRELRGALSSLEVSDRQAVVHAAVPMFVRMYDSGRRGAPSPGMPTDDQVRAKDALVDLYPIASVADQELIRPALLDWITSDFGGHYLPGRYDIDSVMAKVGPAAATALVDVLSPANGRALGKMAELIAKHGDDVPRALASERLAEIGRALGKAVPAEVFAAMSHVCGEPVTRFALEHAASRTGDASSRALALSCVVEGAVGECAPGCGRVEDVEALLAIADDQGQDERVRAAAYDALRSKAPRAQAHRFLSMLGHPDLRYKAVGVDLALHVGGLEQAVPILEQLGRAKAPWPWKRRISGGREYGLCNMGLGQIDQPDGMAAVMAKALAHPDPFVRGGAANVLGVIGTAAHMAALEALRSDGARLRGWQPPTVGGQAAEAIGRITAPDRPESISARRGKACGL